MSIPVKSLYRLLYALAILLVAGCRHGQASQPGLIVISPYAQVDWATVGRYRANFHTHTTGSDGSLNPHDAVDRYHGLGYKVLAITDHDAVTWPWTAFSKLPPSPSAVTRFERGQLESPSLVREDRDPDALGMVAISGTELSSHHHTGSYFSEHVGTKVEEESLVAIGAKNGLAMLNHPGRYQQPLDWYIGLYQRFPHLFGIEVFNQGDRYPGDRPRWDAILTALMPARPVWAHSNDDMHRLSHLGRNYNVMLLPELTSAWVRRGLIEGRSYFVYSPAISAQIAAPVIAAIDVDHDRGRIRLHTEGESDIVWISQGQAIHRGDTLDLAHHPSIERYVRAELHGENGIVVGTQPFGISRPLQVELRLAAQPGAVAYVDSQHVQGHLTLRNVTGTTLSVALKARIGKQPLLRRSLSVAAGQTMSLPVDVPLTALNGEPPLEVAVDLGSAYGRLRRYLTTFPLTVPLPLSAVIDTPSTSHARVRLQSLLNDRPCAYTIAASLDGREIVRHSATLAAGADAEILCPLPAAALGKLSRLDATVSWEPALGAVPGRFQAPIDLRNIQTVQPRVPSWETPPDRLLNSAGDIAPEDRRDRWQGPADSSVAITWGSDGNDLWLAAAVTDDRHVNRRTGDQLWSSDALQIGVVPVGAEPTNIAFALTHQGVRLHQWRGVDRNLAKTATCTVDRDEAANLTRYLIRLPLASLGIANQPGTIFGLNAVVFDDDGEGWDYWMQLGPGLAGGWKPERFGRFALAH